MKVVLLFRSGLWARLISLFRKLARRSFSGAPRGPSGATSAGESLAAAPESALRAPAVRTNPERHLIVGVDFGTSTTKVIWQDLTDNHFEVVRWHPDERGSASWLLPSTVFLRDGALHFGIRRPVGDEEGVWLRSLKLCLLCRRKRGVCHCGIPGAERGNIRVFSSDRQFPASAFASLFLAYVFREVEERLARRFPGDKLVLIWNIGCPMDFADAEGYRRDWERMAGVAMALRMRAVSGVSLSLVAECERRLASFEVPAQEERNYFVQPEGLAAVKAFLESPDAEMKTYAIVDVGAGTTEVSFFFNGRAMEEPGQPFRPSCLADSTDAVGGVRIDQELAEKWGCSVEEARKRKELGRSPIPLVSSMIAICEQYSRTCSRIAKERLLAGPEDKHFDLFLIGGGSRLKPLRVELERCELPGGFARDCTRKILPPRKMSDSLLLQADYHLLAVACGLASSLDWSYYPNVDPIPGEPARPRVDLEELYPK